MSIMLETKSTEELTEMTPRKLLKTHILSKENPHCKSLLKEK